MTRRNMLRRTVQWALGIGVLSSFLMQAQTQESTYGFSLPVTLSGGAMYTGRLQLEDPGNTPAAGGVNFMAYPTVTLGAHWFAYAAEQFRYAPYYYYDAYYPEHEWYVQTIQAFLGYQIRREKTSVVFKAGRLASAFGAFPLHYDDADNPLLDQPLSYVQTLTLGNNQLPCGVRDLLWQSYGWIANRCGGASGADEGLTPVSLYGLPGVEAEISSHRIDARIQVASGSPANALSVSHAPQYAQWVAGGGYTIRQGWRVGVSGFRGPYLSPGVAPFLPAGTSVRSFPASGLGLDAQWAWGHWSTSGEWQRFEYNLPGFTTAPSVISAYAEAKRSLTPRFYAAGRAGWLDPRGAADSIGISTSQFAPAIQSYELGGGWWLNRHQLLKASYEWLRIGHQQGTTTNVLGIEFVTTFHAIDQAFH